MTLNDRERFILHTMSIITVDSMVKKMKNNTLDLNDVDPLTPNKLMDLMYKIGEGRCRKLKVDDINKLYDEIGEEILLGNEVHRDNI